MASVSVSPFLADEAEACSRAARPRRPLPARIALFSGNYNYIRDGANQALNRLVGCLEQWGTQVRVYSPTTSTPAFEPTGELVAVRSVPFPGRSEYRIALGLPRAVRANVEAFAPDVIHVASPDWLGTGAQRLARRLGVPIVASMHTRFETYFDYYGLGWIRDAVQRRLDRFYNDSDFILLPTIDMLDEFAASYGRPKSRLWGRGVDQHVFTPERRSQEWRERHGIAASEVALLFFGRLVLEKGTAVFAEIAQTLIRSGRPVRPVIIGDGPERSWLEQQLPGAAFLGHLNGTELATAVASTDLLINPSLTEAFGNVVLEGMASGLPVIAPPVPSATNLIDHDVSGILTEGANGNAFVKAADELISDPARCQRIGRAAREAAVGRTWSSSLEAVLDVYSEAIGR
jgi:glycosyltransferase involved in cell wall biosynthesis